MAVRLEGAIELRKALRKFSPDLAKQLDQEMRIALKPVVAEARRHMDAEVPLLFRVVRLEEERVVDLRALSDPPDELDLLRAQLGEDRLVRQLRGEHRRQRQIRLLLGQPR